VPLPLSRIEDEYNNEELFLVFISEDAKTIELKSLNTMNIPVPVIKKNIIVGIKNDAIELSI